MTDIQQTPTESESEYRMYVPTMYNISPIQKGIQAAHANAEYEKFYGEADPNYNYAKWLSNFQLAR